MTPSSWRVFPIVLMSVLGRLLPVKIACSGMIERLLLVKADVRSWVSKTRSRVSENHVLSVRYALQCRHWANIGKIVCY